MHGDYSFDESLNGMRIRFGMDGEAEFANCGGSHRANCADAEAAENREIAERGLSDLKKEVDAYLVIPNDKLLSIVEAQTSAKNAFALADEILRQVLGFSDHQVAEIHDSGALDPPRKQAAE